MTGDADIGKIVPSHKFPETHHGEPVKPHRLTIAIGQKVATPVAIEPTDIQHVNIEIFPTGATK
jgi:hypothetical protein